MKQRVISGAVLVVIALAVILAGSGVLAAALLIVSCIAFGELCRAAGVHTNGKKANGLELAGYAGIAVYYMLLYFGQGRLSNLHEFLALCILVCLMVMMAVYVLTFPKYKATQVMAGVFSLIYAPVMLSFIYLTRSLPYGIYFVWMIFISSWICDTCAYFTGVTLGRHKLTPVLSPKKSIEGAIGGIAGSAVVGAVFAYFVAETQITDLKVTGIFAVVSAVGAVISQIGDLAASGIKRDHGIKDYGRLIPGHGGIMDRFDSVIFTAPMIYLLLILLV
ncbi:MAG: phosphatidate cytidylyltransferase [Lachnospiraceae bacterium]|nr:phosphatidate cytidylyltransferase [Lachnospiraceae bacterium]